MNREESILDLPAIVWTVTCKFLTPDDQLNLHATGSNPQQGTEAYFLPLSLDFYLLSSYAIPFPYSGREGKCLRQTLETTNVWQFYRKVKFITNCFHIDPDTYRNMLRAFAGPSSALGLLSVAMNLSCEGPAFLTCPETTVYNLSRFLNACNRGRHNLKISLDIDLYNVNPETFDQLMACSKSDPRCQFLTVLNISDLYELLPETRVLYVHNPTAVFLAKFPNLEYLKMHGNCVKDFVLGQLAETANQLKVIRVTMNSALQANLEHVSELVWGNLRRACPNLRVKCSVSDEDIAHDFFHKLIDPGAPLSCMRMRVDDETMAETIIRRCTDFTDTLELVQLMVLSTNRLSASMRRAVNAFVGENLQFEVSKFKGRRHYYSLTISRKKDAQ